MSDAAFKLGRSSFDEVKNIIKGYAHLGDNVKIDDVVKLLGISKTTISGNNSFLTELGLIEGKQTKQVTPLGKNLGRALEHSHAEDTKKYLREVVQGSEFLSNIVSAIRIKGGMTLDDLASHILYASGQPNTRDNTAGARAVADLLAESGLLVETDGRLQVTITPGQEQIEALSVPVPPENSQVALTPPDKTPTPAPRVQVVPTATIAINIQLHLPETENAEVYKRLFKALREHLLEPMSS